MSEAMPGPDPWQEAVLIARLFAHAPHRLGGLWLRGAGPVRDALLARLMADWQGRLPVRRIPMSIDNERLLGGIDMGATLVAQAPVHRAGVLDEARGGVLVIAMAERMRDDAAALVRQAIDRPDSRLALVLLDEGDGEDEAPPSALTEFCALRCDVSALRPPHLDLLGEIAIGEQWADAMPTDAGILSQDQRVALAQSAMVLGVTGVRPLLFAEQVALAHAAISGRHTADEQDCIVAAQLVFAHRATMIPQSETEPEAEPPPPPPPESENDGSDEQGEPDQGQPLDDVLLAAALAAIPQDLLDRLGPEKLRSRAMTAGRAGARQRVGRRGRPVGARPGKPGPAGPLALIDTLRTAAPWQAMRRAQAGPDGADRLHIRADDLRIKHFEQKRESLTIFAVDASGSAALARLAEAKGAVELMLAQAYARRSQVALVAFRQTGAQLLLPPTRSLTRARRTLSELPGGGGTPLAAGLDLAAEMAEAALRRGQSPTIALLTDGKANVARDGTGNRPKAMEEARLAARRIAALAVGTVVIDISPRARPEAKDLASNLGARYIALPNAQARDMVAAIDSAPTAQSNPGTLDRVA